MPSFAVPSWLLPLCLSPAAGSFIGVLIRRLPTGRSATWSHSQCDTCKRRLSPLHLVPIASYLALRGRCGACGVPIAPFHVVIEIAGIAVVSWAAIVDNDSGWLWSACLLGWALLALAWIDAQHMYLPDAITLPLLVIGIAVQAVMAPERLQESLVGAVVGYVSFRGISLIYRAICGRDGLGMGDAKLLAVSGAWVGWEALPDLVLLAALLAIAAAILMRTRGETIDRLAVIPFGPFLASSLWVTYLYGPLLFCAPS